MAIGKGGNDQGTSIEFLFDEASKVGNLVVATVEKRSNLKIKDNNGKEEKPNIPFLEFDKLTPKHLALIKKGEQIDDGSVEDAKMASLALSIESAVQIVEAKSVREPGVFIEQLASLKEMEAMLEETQKFVKSETEKSESLVGNVAMEVITQKKLIVHEVPENLSSWANDIVGKAHERMSKKVKAVESLDQPFRTF